MRPALVTGHGPSGGQPHPAVQPEHRRGGHHRLGDNRGRQLLRMGPLCLCGVVDRVLRVVLLIRHDILPSGFARKRERCFAEGQHELACGGIRTVERRSNNDGGRRFGSTEMG